MFGLFGRKTETKSAQTKGGGGCCCGSHVRREGERKEASQGGKVTGFPAAAGELQKMPSASATADARMIEIRVSCL